MSTGAGRRWPRAFTVVAGILVVVAVAVVMLARTLSGQSQPVMAPGAPPADLDGRAIYNVACAACHSAGVAGAPRTGDPNGWGPRLEQGMDALVKHAIEGFHGRAGYMPPRGGHSNLTDEQVRDAVQYMVDAIES